MRASIVIFSVVLGGCLCPTSLSAAREEWQTVPEQCGRTSPHTQWVHSESACFVVMPVLFERNSSRLTRAAKAALDNLIACARTHENPRIVLDGHCESREPAAIALRRALAAREYLISQHGFAGYRIIVRSFAQSCPIGGHLDRRVEHVVLPQSRQPADIVKQGCSDRCDSLPDGAEPADASKRAQRSSSGSSGAVVREL